MLESRSAIRLLLRPPVSPGARRIAIAGVAGILLTAPLSLQQAVAPYPIVSWLLTLGGAVLAVVCLRTAWTPRATVARAAILLCIIFCAVSCVLGISQTASALTKSDQELVCADDVTPDTVVGGQEVVQGIDPYTSFNLLDAEKKLGCPGYSVTALRSGVFGSLASQPSPAQIEAAAEATVHGHPTGGLLVGFNYPAGTALLGVLGGRALVLISPLALLLAGLVIARRTEPSLRRTTILALGAQAGLLGLIGSPHVDVVVAALLMLAISKRRGPASGIALGLACALKQTAWFIAPALLVVALREGRIRDLRYQAGALVGFGAINLPFIVAGPSAWITGVFAPQTQPVFPFGFGPGAAGAAGSGVVAAFASLAIAAVVVGTVVCAVAPHRWAPAGIIVSSLGLWLGPRSLGNYVALLGIAAVCTVIGSTFGRGDLLATPARRRHTLGATSTGTSQGCKTSAGQGLSPCMANTCSLWSWHDLRPRLG